MELAYSFRGSVHYHHGGKYGSMWAEVVLGKELRAPYLDLQAAEGNCHSRPSLSTSLSPQGHRDTLPPARSHLLIVPLPRDQAFKHASPQESFLFQQSYVLYFVIIIYLFLFCFVFQDRVSLCSSGWPGTHSVGEASLKLPWIHLLLLPECWD